MRAVFEYIGLNCVGRDSAGGRLMSMSSVSTPMRLVTLLLPALDEAGAISSLIDEIPFADLERAGWRCEVLLVDGGSKDSTVEIAEKYGCEIIHQGLEKGKGAGMRLAFEHFTQTDANALVMIDADGTYAPKDIVAMIQALDENDVVVGSRLQGEIEDGAMTRVNYLGNFMLSWFATILYGEFASDLCSGAWAFRRDSIKEMNLNSVHFEIEAEMFASCALADFSIGFVPITYRCRIGEQKLGSIRDGVSILRKLLIRRVFPIAENNSQDSQ